MTTSKRRAFAWIATLAAPALVAASPVPAAPDDLESIFAGAWSAPMNGAPKVTIDSPGDIQLLHARLGADTARTPWAAEAERVIEASLAAARNGAENPAHARVTCGKDLCEIVAIYAAGGALPNDGQLERLRLTSAVNKATAKLGGRMMVAMTGGPGDPMSRLAMLAYIDIS